MIIRIAGKTSPVTEAVPKQLKDHNYVGAANHNFFLLDQQYADDIGWASTGIHILDQIETNIPAILKTRNLNINQAKTEKYSIIRNGDDCWKKCKYVGSLLGTNEDINRRIGITNSHYKTLGTIFGSKKVSQQLKFRIFNALLENIFLYNSEVWRPGLNQSLEEKIDIFQRRLLRNILNIKWNNNNWLSNNELYDGTKQIPWSKKIAYRRLHFFGHVAETA